MKILVLFLAIVWVAVLSVGILAETPTTVDPTIIHRRVEQRIDVTVALEGSESIRLVQYDLPDANGRKKTYMDFRTITDTSSPQYALQALAETSDRGIRTYNGQYMVALGTYYADYIGQRFIITFDCGTVIQAVVGDFKANIDTDDTNRYIEHNENIVEFIIDAEIVCDRVLTSGDVSGIIALGDVAGIFKIKEVG